MIEENVAFQGQTMQISADLHITNSDYNMLTNKPTLDGRELCGDIKEMDPTVPQWAKEQKKPSYTPEEVGAVASNDAITLEEINQMFNSIFG